MSINLSELNKLSEAEQEQALDLLIERTRQPLNGYEDELRGRIASYERRYEIKSERLLEELRTRQRQETWDMVPWLIALRELADIEDARRENSRSDSERLNEERLPE